LILTDNDELAKKFDSAVFPGTQGGPLMHVIAAKAVALGEALRPSFRTYQQQVRKNAVALADRLTENGFSLFTGGTDNHLMLLDLRPQKLTGRKAQLELDEVGLTTNKNAIPYDTEKPWVTSGIRIGTPATTSRGFLEPQFHEIADLIKLTLTNVGSAATYAEVRSRVQALCDRFPVYLD